jgi:hypothetical protein
MAEQHITAATRRWQLSPAYASWHRKHVRHGFPFGTIVVLNRTNVAHPEELADFLTSLGVKSTKINPISMSFCR